MCPRCGYRGEGLPYFSRGTHVAGLVGATVLTAGAMGAGGLVYYLVRREHQICPRCGRGWGQHGERAVVRAGDGRPAGLGSYSQRRGGAKHGWSIVLFVMAALLMIPGIMELELGAVMVAMLFALGGVALRRSARLEREQRRDALIASLQPEVLQLASRQGGQLTVTQVAAGLGWTLPRAEKVLHSLDDGLRVDSEVTDEGVIVYHFRELSREPGSDTRWLSDPER